MGRFEAASAKKTRTQNVRALVLGSIAVAGVLAVGLVAPNVLGGLGKLGVLPGRRGAEYVGTARKRLQKQGLIVERNGFLRLTHKGERQLRKLVLSLRVPNLKRWDGKWRVLIFDIPERRRKQRIGILRQLQGAGFARVQDSVWLYPYPCEEYVALLKAEMRVGKDLLYLIVDSMEGDIPWRRHFGLPLPEYTRDAVQLPALVEMLLDPVLPKNP